jgi:hypothetical protein
MSHWLECPWMRASRRPPMETVPRPMRWLHKPLGSVCLQRNIGEAGAPRASEANAHQVLHAARPVASETVETWSRTPSSPSSWGRVRSSRRARSRPVSRCLIQNRRQAVAGEHGRELAGTLFTHASYEAPSEAKHDAKMLLQDRQNPEWRSTAPARSCRARRRRLGGGLDRDLRAPQVSSVTWATDRGMTFPSGRFACPTPGVLDVTKARRVFALPLPSPPRPW